MVLVLLVADIPRESFRGRVQHKDNSSVWFKNRTNLDGAGRFQGAVGRRRALIRTAISSGRGLTKSRRMRPSGVSETRAGIELAVSSQPAGRTTALRGRPNV